MKTVDVNEGTLRAREVGNLLREARELKGLSSKDVGELIKVPEFTIEAIENGQIENHLTEIYGMLCAYEQPTHKIFRGFFNSDFLDKPAGVADVSGCVEYVLDCIRFQKSLNGRPTHLTTLPLARGKSNGKPTDLSQRSSTNKRKAFRKIAPSVLESRARDVINAHKLFKLPINVYQVAHNLGSIITFENFPSDFFMKLRGFSYKEDSFSLIGINRNHPVEMQRFTMAHELHHLLYDFNSMRFLCGPENAKEAFEQDAEQFAAELLMPRDLVQKLASHPLNIRYLTIQLVAWHFGVSYEAAAIRLSKIGLISDATEACEKPYRQKDKKKTTYLLENKREYLTAVFGLETAIPALQLHTQNKTHSLCGAYITDPSHNVCWRCGLELHEPSSKEYCLKSPYRQHPSNLSSSKILSVEQKKEDYRQLTFNLDVRKK